MTDPDADEELLAAVRGLGEAREPDAHARGLAAELDLSVQPDLRGDRDRDPDAPNPWRST
ncbi:MAG: hypothetical protein ABR608_00880 [Pseudonocardiaceae bacterium]